MWCFLECVFVAVTIIILVFVSWSDLIQDATQEIQKRRDFNGQTNGQTTSSCSTPMKSYLDDYVGKNESDLKTDGKEFRLVTNRLAFKYIIEKQKNKHLKEDIQRYKEEHDRLEQVVADLVFKLNSTKQSTDKIQSLIDVFQKEWLLLLEASRNDINGLKKTILKKHIQFSSNLSKEQLIRQSKEFATLQLELNSQIDRKNEELMRLKDAFIHNLNLKKEETNKTIDSQFEFKRYHNFSAKTVGTGSLFVLSCR